MRRVLALIISLILLLGYCVAEENVLFEFRNGIRFGDSREEIKAKEIDTSWLREDENTIYYKHQTLSTIEESILTYWFQNGEDKMSRIQIDYNRGNFQTSKQEYHEGHYQTIENGLTSKYGPAIEFENSEDLYRFSSGCIYDYYKAEGWEYIASSIRTLPYDDSYEVQIEHVLAKKQKEKSTSYMHSLTYHLVNKNREFTDPVEADL